MRRDGGPAPMAWRSVRWLTRSGTRSVRVLAHIDDEGKVCVQRVLGAREGGAIDLSCFSAGERFSLYETVRAACRSETP